MNLTDELRGMLKRCPPSDVPLVKLALAELAKGEPEHDVALGLHALLRADVTEVPDSIAAYGRFVEAAIADIFDRLDPGPDA